ncbi:Uncharacterised protein [Achromobacter xylosoxidans]|nr:Uncharacterised protein [Achromobacter xylosoxidans]
MNSPGSCAPVVARNPAASVAALSRSPLRRPWPALALALTLALAGCGSKEAEAPAPRPVVAMPAKADAALPAWTLPGEVQARYSTPLSFRVGGKIIERKVRLGETVKPGQVVAGSTLPTPPRTPPPPAPSCRPRSTSSTTPSSSWTATAPRPAKT